MKNILLYSIFLVFMTSTQAQTQLGKYSFDGTVNAIVTDASGSSFLIAESLAEPACADRDSEGRKCQEFVS